MGHSQGGGGKLPHGHVGGGKGPQGVHLVLPDDVVLFLHGSSLLCTPVLKPDFNLKQNK